MSNALQQFMATASFRWERAKWLDGEHMPAELRRGRLLMAEQAISTDRPVPMVGKPDAVYITQSGLLSPVEVKSHGRVTPSDVLQIACYGVLLRYTDDESVRRYGVAGYGYARLMVHGQPLYVQVPFLPDRAVIKAWQEWERQNNPTEPSHRGPV